MNNKMYKGQEIWQTETHTHTQSCQHIQIFQKNVKHCDMPFWIPFLQKKCNQDNMQYLCMPFTFQSISAYLIHMVPPQFKRKTGDTYFDILFSLNGPCRWSRMPGFYEDEFAWHEFHVRWGRASVTFHLVQTDIRVSAHVRTHIRAHAHTHTHTHSLSCSFALSHCTLSCTVMQIKQRSETQMKVTLNSIIFTYF